MGSTYCVMAKAVLSKPVRSKSACPNSGDNALRGLGGWAPHAQCMHTCHALRAWMRSIHRSRSAMPLHTYWPGYGSCMFHGVYTCHTQPEIRVENLGWAAHGRAASDRHESGMQRPTKKPSERASSAHLHGVDAHGCGTRQPVLPQRWVDAEVVHAAHQGGVGPSCHVTAGGRGRREGAAAAGWPARHAHGCAAHLPEMTWMGLPSRISWSSLMPKEPEPPTAPLAPAATPAAQTASSSS